MEMGQLKTQLLTMMMMKSSSSSGSTGAAGAQAKGPMSDIFAILYGMMVMSFVEWLFRVLPGASQQVFQALKERYKPKREIWNPLADKKEKKEEVNSITMTRVYGNKEKPASTLTPNADNIYVEKVDAVLDYICALDNAKHVKMDTRYSLNTTEEIELTPLIRARVKQTAGTAEEGGAIIELVLYSSKLKISGPGSMRFTTIMCLRKTTNWETRFSTLTKCRQIHRSNTK
jgi:hypothetical protein